MDSSIPPEYKTAYQDCQNMASLHYENFPVASLLLPKEIRPHVAALYAFARTADDFADEDAYKGRRLQKINQWEKNLKTAIQGKKTPAILQAFAHTLKTFKIPLSLPLDLLKAYRMDLTQKRYKSWKDLLYYCRHSANPVGRMVLLLSNIRQPRLHRYSDYICTSLQLTNFWQDTTIDLGRTDLLPSDGIKKSGCWRKRPIGLKKFGCRTGISKKRGGLYRPLFPKRPSPFK